MNLFKSTVAAAAIITCCLGNEMPAKADATKKAKIAALDSAEQVLRKALAAHMRGDHTQLCPAQKQVEEITRPYGYFGHPKVFGPSAVKENCAKAQRLIGLTNNSSQPNNGILNECRKEWGTDYKMVKYCVEEQTAAKRALGL